MSFTVRYSHDQFKSFLKEYDEDGSGFISKKELQQWMMKTGKSLTESQTDRLLSSIDFNNDGCIDYREFLIIVIRRIISANAYKW